MQGRRAPGLYASACLGAPGLVAAELGRAPLQRALVGRDLGANVVLAELGAAALAPALVLRLQHLVDVLELELDLVLVGPRGLPVEHLGARGRMPLTDRDEDPEDQDPHHHHRDAEERIVDWRSVARIAGPWSRATQ